MSVLSLLKKVKVQTLSFEKHPCRELDQEVMVHYLNGLALITNEDGNVCEKEREYLSMFINSFGLSEDMLETFVNFAENPDEKLILDMMQSFATKDIKYNFMVDAMMIASIDGDFDESEEAIVEQYFEMFKITKKEAKDLRYIYEMFYTQNGNALFRYFEKSENSYMKKELFQYLIDYYKIDFAYELLEWEREFAYIDETTSLVWELKTEKNVNDTFTFEKALEYAESLNSDNYLGYSDWRVPTKEELETIIQKEEKYNEFYILEPLSLFCASNGYWSSTTNEGSKYYAWVVDFSNGYVGYYGKNTNYFVRCVRAGQ